MSKLFQKLLWYIGSWLLHFVDADNVYKWSEEGVEYCDNDKIWVLVTLKNRQMTMITYIGDENTGHRLRNLMAIPYQDAILKSISDIIDVAIGEGEEYVFDSGKVQVKESV